MGFNWRNWILVINKEFEVSGSLMLYWNVMWDMWKWFDYWGS